MNYVVTIDSTEREIPKSTFSQNAGVTILGLEILRFICAVGVLMWHYQHFYQIPGTVRFDTESQPLYSFLEPFYKFGAYGVQLFWGVSGFVFFWKYGQVISERAISPAQFFVLRFSRLYPLHLATLLFVATMHPLYTAIAGKAFVYHGNNFTAFLAQLLMASQWVAAAPYTFNGPIWSVSAEVFVYTFFFILVRYLGPGWLTIAGAIVASLTVQYGGLAAPVVFCASYFFAGGAAARLLMDAEMTGRLKSQGRLAVLGLVAFLAVWLGSEIKLNEQKILLILFLGMPLLLLSAGRNWRVLQRWRAVIQNAGNLTYSSYLTHFPLQLIVAVICVCAGIAPPVESPWFLMGYLTVTLVVSWLVFERFERPMQAWIRKLKLGTRAPSP